MAAGIDHIFVKHRLNGFRIIMSITGFQHIVAGAGESVGSDAAVIYFFIISPLPLLEIPTITSPAAIFSLVMIFDFGQRAVIVPFTAMVLHQVTHIGRFTAQEMNVYAK